MEPVCTEGTALLAFINAPWAGTLLGTVLVALVTGLVTYLIAIIKNNCAMKIKKAELLFNQKVTTYSNFLMNAGVDKIAETNAHLDILNSLSCVELIADEKLYNECHSLTDIFIGICEAVESSDGEKRLHYAKKQGEFIRTVKELMRAEIKNLVRL